MTEQLRIGLYICHCGLNIAGVIDPEALAAQGAGLPGVSVCRTHLYSCSEAGQKEIQKDIKSLGLNRLVVAACSPKLHETTFRRLLKDSGLNPYLLEIVNIREHCTWVHAAEPAAAAVKALELIRMGLARVQYTVPLADRRVPLTRSALVVGGGPAGLRVALDIAAGGVPVTLVEREPVLGGMANRLYRTFPANQTALSLINPIMAAVMLHPHIQVLTATELVEVKGHLGSYQVKLRQQPRLISDVCDACGRCAAVCPVTGPGGRSAIYRPAATAFPGSYVVDLKSCIRCGLCVPACPLGAIDLAAAETEQKLKVGSLVVATGALPFEPRGSAYEAWAAIPGVITTPELEQWLAPQGKTGGQVLTGQGEPPREVAFILCVGSREEEGNRYCSRICCPTALKQALELKALLPETRIRIYYRDIRTIKQGWEELYTRAREAGVLFLRGRVQELAPAAGGGVMIRGHNELFRTDSQDRVDLAVLAVGLIPGHGGPLREVLKLPAGPDGFFLEAHPKLRPLETVLDGIFLAGTCQGPKDLSESLTQASGAAAKVLALCSHETISLDGLICEIDPEKCVGCGACVKECPFQAVALIGRGKKKKARITVAACKGCGVCAGACPSGAVTARGFTDEMIMAQIDAALEMEPERKILAFCCNWCSYAGADFAGVSRMQYPPAVRIIRTMCAGRLHPKFILHSFALGAGRVLVSGCHPPGDCHYIGGNLRAAARVEKLWPKLEKEGIDPGRLRLEWISATEGKSFQKVIQELAAELEKEQTGRRRL